VCDASRLLTSPCRLCLGVSCRCDCQVAPPPPERPKQAPKPRVVRLKKGAAMPEQSSDKSGKDLGVHPKRKWDADLGTYRPHGEPIRTLVWPRASAWMCQITPPRGAGRLTTHLECFDGLPTRMDRVTLPWSSVVFSVFLDQFPSLSRTLQ
jgi:hypothetical protein